jgi:hypothetical protein
MGPVLNRKDIVLALDGLNGARSMAIFFGHGIATALLGPPRAEETSVVSGQGTHSQIYDDDLVERGPNALFAFCCLVGRDLGPRFGKLSDRSFLGYDDYLPIDLMNEECVETWKSIVQRISKQLIQDKDIRDEHEMQLRRSYETALAYYNSGDGKDNQEHIEMQMYILRHLKALRRY